MDNRAWKRRSAFIKNKGTYPTGEVRELTLPAAKYKALIRQTMPLARARGDRSSFSDVSYAVGGSRVRNRASRFSELKNSRPRPKIIDAGHLEKHFSHTTAITTRVAS